MKLCKDCGGLKFEEAGRPKEAMDRYDEWCKCYVIYRELAREALVDAGEPARTWPGKEEG